jgi:7-cyano-7-deazaguanine reductase
MNINDIPLGKPTDYPNRYDPSLLYPVARQLKRDEISVANPLPFHGSDLWTAYEVSWLNAKGKPQVAIVEFEFPCDTPNIIESKSFKLYLNSFNQQRMEHSQQLVEWLQRDLSAAAGGAVSVHLFSLMEYQQRGFGNYPGQLLDELDIDCDHYHYAPELLTCDSQESVQEVWISHLLKSNCLITSQPDWASVIIDYRGPKIDPASLLRYLVSFRNHNEFHEQCVERIFQDISRLCAPEQLTVIARYTRRGGLDINPWRSNCRSEVPFLRLARQ